MNVIRSNTSLALLLVVVLLCTTLPYVYARIQTGPNWQGVLPTYSDELNFARVHAIGEGNLTDGNAYLLEHSDGPPLVIFGGAWINAIPLWLGIPYQAALYINFIIFSILFALTGYWLMRELRAPPWLAAVGTFAIYIEWFAFVWRPDNMQTVWPVYFLFYIALIRFMREQSRARVIFLGLVTGASFYLYSYMWQAFVITLGLYFLWALGTRNWPLLTSIFYSSLVGGVIGLPVVAYTLYLSHTVTYFWESMSRLGLVYTHLPTSESIYSGGWIVFVLVVVGCLYWRSSLKRSLEFAELAQFAVITGLGLSIMQNSNVITGIWLETADHVRHIILPWLIFITVALGTVLWNERARLTQNIRWLAISSLTLLTLANIYFVLYTFNDFSAPSSLWSEEQSYTGVFNWLSQNSPPGSVVWSDPHDHLTLLLPIYTHDFTLYAYWGMLELLPNSEVEERYLVSQYFNDPTLQDLSSDKEMNLYLGRHDFPHEAKTIEREVKICRLLFFWDKSHDCGTVPTPQSLLGEQFFAGLENHFVHDIKPNIGTYLAKYHVSYILKDTKLDPLYHPEALGATRVYSDGRFEIYKL